MFQNKIILVCAACVFCGCASGNSHNDATVGDDADVSHVTDVSVGDIADTGTHDDTVVNDTFQNDAVADADAGGTDLSDLAETADQDVTGDVSDVGDAIDGPDVTVEWSCPVFGTPTIVGNLDSSPLTEASGLAVSRQHAGVMWSHNDSGDAKHVYAILTSAGGALVDPGTIVYQFTFKDPLISLSDCEDIAIGPFAAFEGDSVFLADVGNNGSTREVLSVYVFAEPDVIATSEIENVVRIDVKYPDGRHDCEAFFVDPLTGDLYFVVKEYDLAVTKVYRMAAPPADFTLDEVPVELTFVGQFPFEQATGADMSEDGSILVVRGYSDGLYFQRNVTQSVEEMLAGKTCVLPTFPEEPYSEFQGEAIAMAPDGSGFYTVSERLLSAQDVHFTALNPPIL